MKITLNPLAQLKKRAERAVNYQMTATAQDLAHDRKRQQATAVAAGAAPDAAFAEAAAIEGMTPAALATLIMAKPDVLMAQENARRRLVVQIRAAKTAGEIGQILAANAVASYPADRLIDPLP